MVIIHIRGGLGNQMFQYALFLSFAEKGIDASIDLSHYSRHITTRQYELGKVFGIKAPVVSLPRKISGKLAWKLFHGFYKVPYCETDETFGFYDDKIPSLRSAYLKGYWQSEKYFNAAAAAVLKSFSFSGAGDEENKNLLLQVRHSGSVSIHIRRGDYATSDSNFILPVSYYRKAIEYITNRIAHPEFFVFSDDPAWAAENLQVSNAVFVSHNANHNSYRDMQLMSCCSHNIIANSSFSWWGAWLNANKEKIVIAPAKWLLWMEGTRDIIPENWVKIAV